MIALRTNEGRLDPNAGIAIGPILFIIAILAILAAAIAAGSGSFTSGTSSETNKTKSSAMLQIGENLRVGMDRITMEGGIAPTSVDFNPADVASSPTTATSNLFAPTGGGVSPPSAGMANNPTLDAWIYTTGVIQNLGSVNTATPLVIAALPVSQGTCSEINNRVAGSPVIPAGYAFGPLTPIATSTSGHGFTGSTMPTTSSTWLGASGTAASSLPGFNMAGMAVGCVYDTDVTTAGCTFADGTCPASPAPTAGPTSQFIFYQVLAVQ